MQWVPRKEKKTTRGSKGQFTYRILLRVLKSWPPCVLLAKEWTFIVILSNGTWRLRLNRRFLPFCQFFAVSSSSTQRRGCALQNAHFFPRMRLSSFSRGASWLKLSTNGDDKWVWAVHVNPIDTRDLFSNILLNNTFHNVSSGVLCYFTLFILVQRMPQHMCDALIKCCSVLGLCDRHYLDLSEDRFFLSCWPHLNIRWDGQFIRLSLLFMSLGHTVIHTTRTAQEVMSPVHSTLGVLRLCPVL